MWKKNPRDWEKVLEIKNKIGSLQQVKQSTENMTMGFRPKPIFF